MKVENACHTDSGTFLCQISFKCGNHSKWLLEHVWSSSLKSGVFSLTYSRNKSERWVAVYVISTSLKPWLLILSGTTTQSHQIWHLPPVPHLQTPPQHGQEEGAGAGPRRDPDPLSSRRSAPAQCQARHPARLYSESDHWQASCEVFCSQETSCWFLSFCGKFIWEVLKNNKFRFFQGFGTD